MPIVGNDQRRVVDRFDVPGRITQAPLPSITAIDTRFQSETRSTAPGIGTGVVISPNYVLTAAHNLFVKGNIGAYFTDIRVTSSNQQKNLNSRALGATNRLDTGNVDLQVDSNVNPLDDPINTVPPGLFLPFVEDFLPAPAGSRPESQADIGLIEVNDRALILDAPPVGLIAFVDPLTVEPSLSFNFRIQTAGYPADNVANSFPSGNPNNEGIPDRNDNDNSSIRPETELDGLVSSLQVQGRDLVLAPGVLDANGNETTGRVERANEGQGERRIQYSTNIDTEQGQSGSPVWGFLPEEYELERIPRVFAVHSRGASAGSAANFGTLIDKEAYDLIIDEIEGDGDPDLLPENAIIGSNPRNEFTNPPNDGNDEIIGTYRKELILGLTGNDTLKGQGANDRIEGNEGDDDLDGGTGKDRLTGGSGDDIIDGGTNPLAVINPFNRENDVAVYSANRSEYKIETETIGIGIIGIGETVTTVTHLNGTGDDGTDTLTNIEILKFADEAVPLSSDDGIIDGLLNFFGDSSDDNIIGNILPNLLLGEAGNDRLEGDDGDDTLKGEDGDDSLFGGDDDDLLQGSVGNDSLEGNAGEDRLYGNEGSDIFRGGDGNDILAGGLGFGEDTLKGEDGDDSITGGGGDDLLQGGNDEDTLFGNGGEDRLFGDAGNDLIYGSIGNDYLSGGNGLDTLKGEDGEDYLTGENGDDLLQGGNGNDELNGDGGSDRLYGNGGNDLLRGSTGNDYLAGSVGKDTLKGEDGKDTLLGGNNDDLLQGGDDNDVLYGQANNDRLFGNAGNDLLVGNFGNDRLWGSVGQDTLKGEVGRDILAGGDNDDLLQGGDDNDILYGQNGNDRLFGNDGNDRLFGGTGENTIAGGAGQDDFVFTSSTLPVGEITDFTEVDDTLQFKVESFAGISTVGMISQEMLTIGSSASDSSDRFIYNSGNGDLFYDSDGSRSSQQVKLAELDAGLAMTNSDFEMI